MEITIVSPSGARPPCVRRWPSDAMLPLVSGGGRKQLGSGSNTLPAHLRAVVSSEVIGISRDKEYRHLRRSLSARGLRMGSHV